MSLLETTRGGQSAKHNTKEPEDYEGEWLAASWLVQELGIYLESVANMF